MPESIKMRKEREDIKSREVRTVVARPTPRIMYSRIVGRVDKRGGNMDGWEK
jgi:hypothetical protein